METKFASALPVGETVNMEDYQLSSEKTSEMMRRRLLQQTEMASYSACMAGKHSRLFSLASPLLTGDRLTTKVRLSGGIHLIHHVYSLLMGHWADF
ncbi:unnamed protein product [Protopolystoma xenopodis]|uniref:Uncharacterized protein n=1 Tax=Protopolystoma xenopodis TaxID=117903 RepID=A0A3S5FFQ2_9PLAT|nr:unnamed protein product [Protopolystoma xenopodis]